MCLYILITIINENTTFFVLFAVEFYASLTPIASLSSSPERPRIQPCPTGILRKSKDAFTEDAFTEERIQPCPTESKDAFTEEKMPHRHIKKIKKMPHRHI